MFIRVIVFKIQTFENRNPHLYRRLFLLHIYCKLKCLNKISRVTNINIAVAGKNNEMNLKYFRIGSKKKHNKSLNSRTSY